MQHTQNYQLSRWEKDDRIMMEDFNADNEKIDAALKANADAVGAEADARQGALSALQTALGTGGYNCRVAFGTYTGDGTYGSASLTSLFAPFHIVAAIIGSAEDCGSDEWPCIFLRGCAAANSYTAKNDASLTVFWNDTSLSWYNTTGATYQINVSGRTYYYVLLGYDT